jgi:hypothetical protein
MVRYGKEPELGNAFKPGSNNPTLTSHYGEEDNPPSPYFPPIETSTYFRGSHEDSNPFEDEANAEQQPCLLYKPLGFSVVSPGSDSIPDTSQTNHTQTHL